MDTLHLNNIQELDCKDWEYIAGGMTTLSDDFRLNLTSEPKIDLMPEIPEMPSWPGTHD